MPNVVIRTTLARAEAIAAILEAEAEYAKSQLQSRGMCRIIDDAVADILADVRANEPEEGIVPNDAAHCPESGCAQVQNGKLHVRKTKSYKKALAALSDGAWHFCDHLQDHGIPRGTINGLMARMAEAGIVETQGKRFRKQYRLAAGVTV